MDRQEGTAQGANPFARAVVEGHVRVDGVGGAEGGVGLPPSEPKPRRGGPPEAQRLQWVEPFLTAIAGGSSVAGACKAIGVHFTTVHQRRRKDPQFAKAWNEALDLQTRMLEQEAQRRAYHGVEKPIRFKGEVVDVERQYSDVLLMFLLKARRPHKYRDGYDEGGRPTSININVVNVDGATPVPEPVRIVDPRPQPLRRLVAPATPAPANALIGIADVANAGEAPRIASAASDGGKGRDGLSPGGSGLGGASTGRETASGGDRPADGAAEDGSGPIGIVDVADI